MSDRAATLSPTVSRQPSCPLCDHESHVFTRCHAELARAAAYLEPDDDTASVPLLCPCPPRRPTGIYDEEQT